ncbi:MAG TPA: hypothetical protein VHT49_03905 [Acidimicrobiales bacterium]|jgi:hypothetical protein|nr:hypothetical protein [Acidimicrobiales bacterium]
MAFGQPTGPQATGRQVQELLALLQEAGHTSFRDARGPMGFNQRQAGGRFTRDEVEAFINRLQAEGDEAAAGDGSPPPPVPTATRTSAAEKVLQTLPAGELAAELRRRGWTVSEP